MAAIKATSTILFAILLSGWGHYVSCLSTNQPPLIRQFCDWLETHLKSHPDDLSFSMKDYVSQDLQKTSTTFQNLAIIYGYELGNPATGLNKAISETFEIYKANECNETILSQIETGDPVGLNVYFWKFKGDFATCVDIFYGTMLERLRLLTIRYNVNPPYKNILDKSIAIEYSGTPDSFVNQFLEFVGRKTNKEMIPVDRSGFDHSYEKKRVDDIQILKGIYYNEQTEEFECHATCIYFNADKGIVYIYDSLGAPLEDKQIAFIKKRYPDCRIKHKQPSFIQNEESSCAIFAMIYTTLLLKRRDPVIYKVRLNKVNGDEALYMRLHIMDMLSKNELYLPQLIKITSKRN